MKTNFDRNDLVNPEFFKLASQLYVKLRRNPGRVIDAVYMVQNQHYAHEILVLASQQHDAEMNELVSRIQAFLPESLPEIPVLRQAVAAIPNSIPVAVNMPPIDQDGHAHDIAAHSTEEVAQHYVGALR